MVEATFAADLEKLERLIDDRNRLYKSLVNKGTVTFEHAAAKSKELAQLRQRYAWLAENAWWIKATHAEIAPLLRLHAHQIEAAKIAAHPSVAEVLATFPGSKIAEISVLSATRLVHRASKQEAADAD